MDFRVNVSYLLSFSPDFAVTLIQLKKKGRRLPAHTQFYKYNSLKLTLINTSR